MKLEMSGFEAMQRQIERLSQKMVKDKAQEAVFAGARVIATAQAEAAPVQAKGPGPHSTALQPGALKADIRARVVRSEAASEVAATFGPGSRTAYVAQWIEFGRRQIRGGYSKVSPDGTARGPGKSAGDDVPPKPFLIPAYERTVDDAIEARNVVLREAWSGKK